LQKKYGQRKKLGWWEPRIKFKDLVKIMVYADLRKMNLEALDEGR